MRRLPSTEPDCILDNYFEVASISDPPLHSSAVAVKRSILEQLDGFPENVGSGEDLLTWARVAVSGPIAYSQAAMATHFSPARLNFNRPDDPSDRVGSELRKLLDDAPPSQKRWLRRYLARWHEMRSVIALGQRNQKIARRHIMQDLRFGGPNMRALALAGICALPGSCAWKVFSALRKGRK